MSFLTYVANSDSNSVSVNGEDSNVVVDTIGVGIQPEGVAITSDGFAYVANSRSSSVSVINTINNSVETTINVGFAPSCVAITPDQMNVYVTNSESNNVSVIDTTTNTVIDTVSVGMFPTGVAITNSSAYVANNFSNNVSVIDIVSREVVETISVGDGPGGVATGDIPNKGVRVYVTNNGSNTVSVINANTNMVIHTINGINFPSGIAVTPDGECVYVTSFDNSNVAIIDTSNNTIVDTIPVEKIPSNIAFSPCGCFAYITNNGSNSVSVINTFIKSVVDTISVGCQPVGIVITKDFAYVTNSNILENGIVSVVRLQFVSVNSPFAIAFTPDGSSLYVTNQNVNTVSVIDTIENAVTATIMVGDTPSGIAITQTSNNETFAYVANFADGTVSVIDISRALVTDTIKTGGSPLDVAITPDGTRAYVTSSEGLTSDRVFVIDTSTNMVTTQVLVGTEANRVAITPDGTRAYVTNQASGNVSVIDTDTASQTFNQVIKTIQLPGENPFQIQPVGIAITPDGKSAYVVNSGIGSVSVINTDPTSEDFNKVIVDRINVNELPQGIAITPDGFQARVTNSLSDNLSVIDTSNFVVDTLPLCEFPIGIATITDITASASITDNSNSLPASFLSSNGTVTNLSVKISCSSPGSTNSVSFTFNGSEDFFLQWNTINVSSFTATSSSVDIEGTCARLTIDGLNNEIQTKFSLRFSTTSEPNTEECPFNLTLSTLSGNTFLSIPPESGPTSNAIDCNTVCIQPCPISCSNEVEK